MSPYVRLGTYVKMGTRTYRTLPSKVRRYVRGDKNKSGLLWLNAKFTAKMEPTKTYHIPNQWKFYEDFAELYKF